MARNARSKEIGRLLRAGHSFREAVRLVDGHGTVHHREHEDRDAFTGHGGRNPSPRPLLVLGALGLGAYLILRQQAGQPAPARPGG